MSLKEKLVSSFLAFELDADINSPVHDIRSKSIKEFEKIGFKDRKNEYWKYTQIKKLLSEELTVLKKKKESTAKRLFEYSKKVKSKEKCDTEEKVEEKK